MVDMERGRNISMWSKSGDIKKPIILDMTLWIAQDVNEGFHGQNQ